MKLLRREERVKKAVIFPGQASQFLGMAADIPQEIMDDLREQTEKALGDDDGFTSFLFSLISKEALTAQGEEKQKMKKRLDKNAQLAVFITSWAMYLRNEETIGVPDFVSGHSLGMYTALCAAKVATFSELITIIKFRQSSMNDACRLFNGSMTVVGGDARKITDNFFEKTMVKIANFNTPTQTVITGLKNELVDKVELRLKRKGFVIKPLLDKVAGAFHHPEYMALASRTLDYILSLPDTAIRQPEIPLVLDIYGKTESDPHKIRRALVNQVVYQVRWTEVIKFFIKQGILKENIIEVGPGRTLTGMLKDFPNLKTLKTEEEQLKADTA